MGHRKQGLSQRVKNYERKRQTLKRRPPGRPCKNPQPAERYVAYFQMVYIQLPKLFCSQLSVSSLKECLQLPNQWINNTASELGANDNIHLCKIQSVPASDSSSTPLL